METGQSTRIWKAAGINFDHMHMGDLLRHVFEHPAAEIVGVADRDPGRMETACAQFGIPEAARYADWRQLLEEQRPDVVLLCPKTAEHARYVQDVAPYGVHVLIEKPMAASLEDADRMLEAMRSTGRKFAVNWPLAWYPPHRTAKRLVDEGILGELIEVHYYDGNRGPLRHLAGKVEVDADEAARLRSESWWYQRESAGGSLQDYLGYGVTLGAWFLNGRVPLEVTTIVDEPPGAEVDEHSITVARYAFGLSKYETRWGAFTDPWVHQPQPKCGFTLVGTAGTLSSYDYEPTIRVQTVGRPSGFTLPVDPLTPPQRNPIEYFLHCIDQDEPVVGPLSPELSRVGQRIVEAAVRSAREKRTVALPP